MAGSMSRNKGYRGEKKARELLKELGYKVLWHNEDPSKSDLTMQKNGIKLNTEVKYRSSVPKSIYKYLAQDKAHVAMVKRVSQKDRGYPWVVCLPLKVLDAIIEAKIPQEAQEGLKSDETT